MLFDLLADEAYYSQPIALRHPIVFYEGHLPAFSFNTLVKRALGRPSIDAQLEQLFARGIDPDEADAARGAPRATSGRLATTVRGVRRRGRSPACSTRSTHEDLDRPGHPLLDRAEAVFAILEHEAMHQETLLYMWHRLPFDAEAAARRLRAARRRPVPPRQWVDVPGGTRDARRGPARRSRSAGTTSSRASSSTCRRSRSSATT